MQNGSRRGFSTGPTAPDEIVECRSESEVIERSGAQVEGHVVGLAPEAVNGLLKLAQAAAPRCALLEIRFQGFQTKRERRQFLTELVVDFA